MQNRQKKKVRLIAAASVAERRLAAPKPVHRKAFFYENPRKTNRVLRQPRFLLFFAFLLIGISCAVQKKIIFHPESAAAWAEPGRAGSSFEKKEIIEFQKKAALAMPDWINRFLNGGLKGVESLGLYQNEYIFIARNQGANFNALRQWAGEFTAARDFPRLVVTRIENRLLAGASLYPDDEYGNFFEVMIKKAANAEYPEARKSDDFWVKWRITGGAEEGPELSETGEMENPEVREIYESFVLITIDKSSLRNRIKELMAGALDSEPPTRAQAASINRIRQNFFEGF